jgi:hypothetical protein
MDGDGYQVAIPVFQTKGISRLLAGDSFMMLS